LITFALQEDNEEQELLKAFTHPEKLHPLQAMMEELKKTRKRETKILQ
jgi:hypothetical protein